MKYLDLKNYRILLIASIIVAISSLFSAVFFIVTNSDVNMNTPGSNNDSYITPLFGKPLYKGSQKWLYYTNYNNIKIKK